jgi:hypothetical protein
MTKHKLKFGDAVRVWWMDSREIPGWQYEHPEPHIGRIVTLGYFVKEDDDAVIVAHSIEKSHAFLGTINIPKGAISKIDTLGELSR